MSFPCTQCGACCHVLASVLGFRLRDDGACSHLTPDNRCDVYDHRPDVCQVDGRVARAVLAGDEQRYEATARNCNWFQEVLGIPESYRVSVNTSRPGKAAMSGTDE